MYNVQYDNGEKEYKVIVSRIKLITRNETKQLKSVSSETVKSELNVHIHGSSSRNGNNSSPLKNAEIAHSTHFSQFLMRQILIALSHF